MLLLYLGPFVHSECRETHCYKVSHIALYTQRWQTGHLHLVSVFWLCFEADPEGPDELCWSKVKSAPNL